MAFSSRLLRRQLRTHLPGGEVAPGLVPLLEAVDEAYRRFESGRSLLERSLTLSSDELLQANTELRGMLQALPDLFLTLDAEGRILSYRPPVGPGSMRVIEVRPEERPLIEEAIPGEAGVQLRKAFARLRAGSTIEHFDYTVEFDGERRHREGRIVSLSDERALCICRDVTDLKRAEEALRSSEGHYRLLFDANPQPMWVFDRETFAFLAVNQAAVAHYGWSREEFLAMSVVDIRPPEEVPALLEVMGRLADAPLRPGVFRHRRRDGALIEVETLGNPLHFFGRPAVMVLASDVTERRRMEEQFRQSQRMEAVGQLAGGVAHDFNNLLTVIAGYCELLVKSLGERPSDLRRVQEVHRAATRASALTRQLLTFSRKQPVEPRVLDPDEVVQGMVPMLSRLLGENIRLDTIRGGSVGRVKADPGQLEQVVMNLAINARDAMPGGGALTIALDDVELDAAPRGVDAAQRGGPHVMLAVRDTGCGMDAATRVRIFEPFFTTKEAGKGTGLGLATVYGIVQQSGGAIQVESEPGQGAVFRVYLPRVEEPSEVRAREAEAAPVARGRETVLVVEDEEAVRKLEAESLAAQGYRVRVAADAQEALALAERAPERIDLLVTDVVMPGRSGRELAEELSRRRPGLRVLFVSGYVDDEFPDAGQAGSEVWFLPKPFTPRVLANKVREVLDADRPAQAA